MVKTAALIPRVVVNAAVQQEPHRVAFFLHELRATFMRSGPVAMRLGVRFLRADDPELSRARLVMLQAVRQVLANGCGYGVTRWSKCTRSLPAELHVGAGGGSDER